MILERLKLLHRGRALPSWALQALGGGNISYIQEKKPQLTREACGTGTLEEPTE